MNWDHTDSRRLDRIAGALERIAGALELANTPTITIEACDHLWEARGEGRFCALCEQFELGVMP